MKVLLEMRPALYGHAGIPQENRLLFRGLCQLEGLEIQGLLQSGSERLAEGLPVANGEIQFTLPAHEAMNRLSRVVVSLKPERPTSRPGRWWLTLKTLFSLAGLIVSTVLGYRQRLSAFEPKNFEDFIWRSLFAKTLPVDDFGLVTKANMRIARAPYGAMHMCGLLTHWGGRAVYPKLDTQGVDVLIAQTPFPARLTSSTRMVVRYMDAVPLLMPHTIAHTARHQALHYHALRSNVRCGAYFACASEATRRDLLAVFPELEARAVTIHCMLSHHYFLEDSSVERVPEILAKRRSETTRLLDARPVALSGDEGCATQDYLLMVSTIEPRKNHELLVAAWERLRASTHPGLRLVVVGGLGWDHEPIVAGFRPWLARGDLIHLEDVPAAELRVLYRHALATICPSLGEGFDYSGVEAMRCGGVVVASDLAVHREVFDTAAEYFNPYSSSDAAAAIVRLIGPDSDERRQLLLRQGVEVSARYTADRLLPRWRELLDRIAR